MARQAIQTRYLLGKLSDDESANLEERSFVDDNVFDEIELAEDELIDAYVSGDLSAEDRERFENKLLKSERIAERVEFARLLAKAGSPQIMVHQPAKTGWWPGWFDFSFGPNPALTSAAATALFLVVLALPVFVWMRMRFEDRLTLERAAIEQQKQQQLAQEEARTNEAKKNLETSRANEERLQEKLTAALEALAKGNTQPAPPPSIWLYSDSDGRSSGGGVLKVPSTASTIRLNMVIDTENNYGSLSATIASQTNDNVFTNKNLKIRRWRQSWMIVFDVPAQRLSTGEYGVSVTGRTADGTYDPVGEYSFRIEKK